MTSGWRGICCARRGGSGGSGSATPSATQRAMPRDTAAAAPPAEGIHEWAGEGEKTHPGVSLGKFILDHLRRRAEEDAVPAQVEAATGAELSFPDLLELSLRAAGGWRALGVGAGHTLTVFSRNSEMLFPAVLGAIFEGVTLSGVSPTSTEGELRHCLSLVQPQAVICDTANADMARRVFPTTCRVLVQDAEPSPGASGTLDEVFRAPALPFDPVSYQPADVGDVHEHVAAIFFSSGTTGLPKAIESSNYAMLMSTMDCSSAFRCVPGERLLCTSLMSWVTGPGLLMAATVAGTTRVCDTFTGAAALLASLRRHQINCWFTAPPLLLLVAELARSEALPGPPCPSLRAVVVGGTAMPAAMEEAAARTMHCDVHQTYAASEFLIVSISRKPLRPGSTGRIVPSVRVRLVDVDTGADIRAPGVSGELRVLSPSIMKGYKNNAEATAEAFDEHGYFRSGDLAFLDRDGYLFIVGRLKELMKYNGQKMAPAELEAVLREHPGVAQACVVGRPHPVAGDVPAACVVRRPGQSVTEEELQQFVADRLSRHKRLRGGVVFRDMIPKTSNGKVARRDIVPLFDGHPMQALD